MKEKPTETLTERRGGSVVLDVKGNEQGRDKPAAKPAKQKPQPEEVSDAEEA